MQSAALGASWLVLPDARTAESPCGDWDEERPDPGHRSSPLPSMGPGHCYGHRERWPVHRIRIGRQMAAQDGLIQCVGARRGSSADAHVHAVDEKDVP